MVAQRSLRDFISAADTEPRIAALRQPQIRVIHATSNLLVDLCIHLAHQLQDGKDVGDRMIRVASLIKTFHRLVRRAVYRPSMTGLEIESHSKHAIVRTLGVLKRVGTALHKSLGVLSTAAAVYYVLGHTLYVISKTRLSHHNRARDVILNIQKHFVGLLLDSKHGPLLLLTFIGLYTTTSAGAEFTKFVLKQAAHMGVALVGSPATPLALANAVMLGLSFLRKPTDTMDPHQDVHLSRTEEDFHELVVILGEATDIFGRGFKEGDRRDISIPAKNFNFTDYLVVLNRTIRESGVRARQLREVATSFIEQHGTALVHFH